MSLLDSLTSMAGKAVTDKLASSLLGNYAPIATQLLSHSGDIGGLSGLISMFNKVGLGDIITSWIGKSTNLPIKPDQLHQVLGSNIVKSLAGQAGTDESSLLSTVSKFLPLLVDHATPEGKVPEGDVSQNLDISKIISSFLK